MDVEAGGQVGSVRSLQNLYSVVATVALTLAVNSVISLGESRSRIAWEVLPAVLAFLFTVVPFYHGALRHLDVHYVEAPLDHTYGRRLLWDFVILFLEACVLLAASALAGDITSFIVALIILWFLDIIWGVTAVLILKARETNFDWAVINGVATVAFVPVLVLSLLDVIGQVFAGLLILGISMIRTWTDYRRNWTFYFPPS